jgi:hypothetical protein
VWENVGNNPSGAMRALEKKRACLAYVATGSIVLANENGTTKTNLARAIADWLEIIKEKLSRDSFNVKRLTLEEFLDSYGKKTRPKYIEDIQRMDVLRFIHTYLIRVPRLPPLSQQDVPATVDAMSSAKKIPAG